MLEGGELSKKVLTQCFQEMLAFLKKFQDFTFSNPKDLEAYVYSDQPPVQALIPSISEFDPLMFNLNRNKECDEVLIRVYAIHREVHGHYFKWQEECRKAIRKKHGSNNRVVNANAWTDLMEVRLKISIQAKEAIEFIIELCKSMRIKINKSSIFFDSLIQAEIDRRVTANELCKILGWHRRKLFQFRKSTLVSKYCPDLKILNNDKLKRFGLKIPLHAALKALKRVSKPEN